MLRHTDASLEKWFRQAKQRGARVLRHRVDDLQAGLKKLSASLEQVERDHKVTLERDHEVTPTKRRRRPTIARKPAAAHKPKKAA